MISNDVMSEIDSLKAAIGQVVVRIENLDKETAKLLEDLKDRSSDAVGRVEDKELRHILQNRALRPPFSIAVS